MTKDEFLNLKAKGYTNAHIGSLFGLTPRQVSIRVSNWGLNYSNKKKVDDYFFSKDTKAAYYWAGFIAADGWIASDRFQVGLGLQIGDISHLEKFKSAIKAEHEICKFMDNAAARIRFNSEQVVVDLRERFNITPSKTFTYSLPYFEEDYLLWEFLRGYIDGDGHISKTESGKAKLHLCSANASFLEDYKSICEVALDRTIPQDIYLSVNSKGQVYSLAFGLDDSADILKFLYKNSTSATRLDRKYKVAKLVLDKGIVH